MESNGELNDTKVGAKVTSSFRDLGYEKLANLLRKFS
jgi:hypothetical protein